MEMIRKVGFIPRRRMTGTFFNTATWAFVGAHSANGKGLEFKRVFTSITPNDGENYASGSTR